MIDYSGNSVENDEDSECLLLHTEVSWLSKFNDMKCFHYLFMLLWSFLKTYMLYSAMNSGMTLDISQNSAKSRGMNLQLQGNEASLIETKSVASTFISKFSIQMQFRSSKAIPTPEPA